MQPSEACGCRVWLGKKKKKENWNLRLLWKMVMKLWPFSEALAIIFVKNFLELEEKSAMTAETLLSVRVLITGVLAEAFSDQLNPGTQCSIFSQLFMNKTCFWSLD